MRNDTQEFPCYVISSNGFKDSVSHQDEHGCGRFIAYATEQEPARKLIAEDIRQDFDWRNGLPLYFISDHGNVFQVRRVTLRKRIKP